MDVCAIVLAAGRGLRLKSRTPKPLVKINSRPLVIYSLAVLNKHPDIKDIILVVNDSSGSQILKHIKRYRIGKIRRVVKGGRRRQDSVFCGLSAVARKTGMVLIHDAARPFIDSKTVSSVIKEAKLRGAAIAGVPVKATIKRVKGLRVIETPDRKDLWEIQTPQAFKKELLLRAYDKFGESDATDDAMLVERAGARVSVVPGSYDNIKITTPEDLAVAEALLKLRNKNR
ncbi:MAG: 2-C-methyl-D-erythritol 4-phosphate cytidylyltransferase [Candidatus Omnitrophica bacterium]|nr:2-C-methyl-D-erythritol 4-phosphate cytidylyltransferase [Candidatus Omnitrophota bacterium]